MYHIHVSCSQLPCLELASVRTVPNRSCHACQRIHAVADTDRASLGRLETVPIKGGRGGLVFYHISRVTQALDWLHLKFSCSDFDSQA